MQTRVLRPAGGLRGTLRVPGDKSVTHRALLLAAMADGPSRLSNPLRGGVIDTMCGCLEALGAAIEWPDGDLAVVHGGPWRSPGRPLDCGTSGTTMRLLMGALAGSEVEATLTGSPRLRQRPMSRVAAPLRHMGAHIAGANGGDQPPLRIDGARLRGVEYRLPVASAQVKTALLLAGLQAEGQTVIHEPIPSRDHTERLLRRLGVSVTNVGGAVRLDPVGAPLSSFELAIPGDFSAGAFPLAAAVLVPDSDLTLTGVGLNPTRTGLLDALREMGAQIEIGSPSHADGEPVGDLTVRHSDLRAIEIQAKQVVSMIDEIPILAVMATQAHGDTTIRGAGELRLKESDRLSVMAVALSKMGAQIEQLPDGMTIHGPTPLTGTRVDAHGDHRVAMALAVAGMLSDGETVVSGAEIIRQSFPEFSSALGSLGATVQ